MGVGGGGQEVKEGVAAPFPCHRQAPTPGPHVLDALSGAVPALRGTRGEGAAGATVAGRGCKATEGLLEPAAPRGPWRSAPRMGGCSGGRVGHPHALTLAPRGPCGGGAAPFPSEFRAPAGPGGWRRCLTSGHCTHDAGLCCAPWDCPARPCQPSHPWPPSFLASQLGLRATAGIGEHGCGAQTTYAALE